MVQLASVLPTWNLHSSSDGAGGATGKGGGGGRAQRRGPRAASPEEGDIPFIRNRAGHTDTPEQCAWWRVGEPCTAGLFHTQTLFRAFPLKP